MTLSTVKIWKQSEISPLGEWAILQACETVKHIVMPTTPLEQVQGTACGGKHKYIRSHAGL